MSCAWRRVVSKADILSSIVLADDNKFTADKMQMLCNHLCYSYARATRAVSVSHCSSLYYSLLTPPRSCPLLMCVLLTYHSVSSS